MPALTCHYIFQRKCHSWILVPQAMPNRLYLFDWADSETVYSGKKLNYDAGRMPGQLLTCVMSGGFQRREDFPPLTRGIQQGREVPLAHDSTSGKSSVLYLSCPPAAERGCGHNAQTLSADGRKQRPM